MLGLENPLHILFLLAVLLMLFGAKRLPDMGRGLGEGMRGFRDALSGASAKSQLNAALADTPTEQIVAAAPVEAPPVSH
jgi:sec-independent protein translocase protein TatA